MTLRPLGYSLLIHLFLLIVFIVLYSRQEEEKTSEPLKIRISTLTPSTQPVPNVAFHQPAPSLPQPQKVKQSVVSPSPIPSRAPSLPAPTIENTPAKPLAPTPQLPAPALTAPVVQVPKTQPSAAAPPPPPPAVNVEKEFLDAHLGEIRAILIKNLKYPRNAQRLRMQGEVQVSFRLLSNGSVENINVRRSSGFDLLDEDACTLIKNTASQFPKPTKTVDITVPLSYQLR